MLKNESISMGAIRVLKEWNQTEEKQKNALPQTNQYMTYRILGKTKFIGISE